MSAINYIRIYIYIYIYIEATNVLTMLKTKAIRTREHLIQFVNSLRLDNPFIHRVKDKYKTSINNRLKLQQYSIALCMLKKSKPL